VRRQLPLLLAGAAAVVGVTAGAASAAVTERAHWRLDESGTPTVATDSSGFGNHAVAYNVTGSGGGYVFNGTSSRVVAPDSDSLDPGSADFSFGVSITMTSPPPAGDTYDVFRKGLAGVKGGDYKLEILNVSGTARARCVVRDATRVTVAIVAPTNLADGRPHNVTCSKTSRGVSVTIDALAPRTKSVTLLGSVANANQLALGAKAETTASTGFDWFKGRMDDAWLRVDGP
jgi:hypothetical protein